MLREYYAIVLSGRGWIVLITFEAAYWERNWAELVEASVRQLEIVRLLAITTFPTLFVGYLSCRFGAPAVTQVDAFE